MAITEHIHTKGCLLIYILCRLLVQSFAQPVISL